MLKVVQFVECWLPQTETWIFNHVHALPPSISSSIVCQWTQNLDQFPHKDLFSLERPPVATRLGKRILRQLGWWDDQERHLSLLERVLQTKKPDVLHSHFGHYGWVNSRLANKYSVRHIVSFYGLDVGYLPHSDRRWYSKYRRMNDRVDLVLCEGPHMAKCIEALGIDRAKIKLFRLGIDLESIPFKPRSNTFLDGGLRFLIVGSFREKKGIPYAIEALGLFNQSFPNIEITVIGDAGNSNREQSEKQKIIDQVKRWDLSQKTRFIGYQPYKRLYDELYRHQIFLSPSITAADGDTEGGAPVTIIEAAASGMPVVSTRHCDIPFVLSNENQRFLAPERDPLALCQALKALVSEDDWGLITKANRLLVERELNVNIQSRRLAEIYCKSSQRKKSSGLGSNEI